MLLGLIETSGNQSYIFSSNRLAENVGASEIIWRCGVLFILEAAFSLTRDSRYKALFDAARHGPESFTRAMRARDAPRLANAPLEIVVAASGKAIFLVSDDRPRLGEEVIGAVTLRAQLEAPGVAVRGALATIDTEGPVRACAARALQAVHREIDHLRGALPSAEMRFPTLPVVEPCPATGLPAARISDVYKPKGGTPVRAPSSDVAIHKRAAREDGYARIKGMISRSGNVARSIEDMESLGADWLGVVHADGNGMGELFLGFDGLCEADTLAEFFDAYRDFSLSLDLCGVSAFRIAFDALVRDWGDQNPDARLPIIPLIVGGDDLTLLCDGALAPGFAAKYLQAFREATTRSEILGMPSTIPALLGRKAVNDPDRDWSCLGAAAGVAITKPHYPFHRGYHLAEALLRSAKTAKKLGNAVCSLDFHVLFDNAESSLDDIRDRWTTKVDKTHYRLTARPYIVGNGTEDMWSSRRRWSDLARTTVGLKKQPDEADDTSALSRTQQYALRDAVFRGHGAADAYLRLIRHRFAEFPWDSIAALTDGEPRSLFVEEDCKGNKVCCLIDAMELADLGALMDEEAINDQR